MCLPELLSFQDRKCFDMPFKAAYLEQYYQILAGCILYYELVVLTRSKQFCFLILYSDFIYNLFLVFFKTICCGDSCSSGFFIMQMECEFHVPDNTYHPCTDWIIAARRLDKSSWCIKLYFCFGSLELEPQILVWEESTQI